MSEKIKINADEDNSDEARHESIINYEPLDTATRDDDGEWNVPSFYGGDDAAEMTYVPRTNQSPEELNKRLLAFKAKKLGQRMLDLFDVV